MLIDPCIPHEWDGFKVARRWRGINFNIEVKNPSHVCKGVEYIEVDGNRIDAAVIPADMIKEGTKITAYMGRDAKEVPVERL